MSATKWPTQAKNPTSLALDPKNPRLAQINQNATERELIEELVTKEDVYDLAKSIAESGYFQNEVLVAIREQKKLIVVEGNCRLTACKLLLSPSAAPVHLQPKFRTLAAKANTADLKTIPVCIAPSREATHSLVLKRHTRIPIARWEPPMQAKFYRQLIESGMSVEDIAKNAGSSEGDVRQYLRNHHLYEMACRLDLKPEVAEKVHNPHVFPLSTLGRVFDAAEARKFFGVEVDANGEIVGNIPESEFEKGLQRLVSDLVEKPNKVSSRTLNKATDVVKYLHSFEPTEKPSLSTKGTFKASTFKVAAAKKTGTSPRAKKTKSLRLPTGLIPSTVVCNVTNARVRDIFDELRKLSPDKYKNACLCLLRSLLEMGVFCFLDGKGEIAKMRSEYDAENIAWNARNPTKQPKTVPPNWTPELSAMMQRIMNPSHNLLPPGHMAKALPKSVHDEQELFGFNLGVHNTTYHADEKSLRTSWRRFEEFFKFILA